MGISDEVRREIANGLRRLADGRHSTGVPDSEILDVLEISPADTPNCSDACDVEILADLIDRPTCHDTSDNDFEFKCSKCSAYTLKPGNYHSEVGYVRDSGEHLRYCPNCGAEVVDA